MALVLPGQAPLADPIANGVCLRAERCSIGGVRPRDSEPRTWHVLLKEHSVR